MYYEKMNISFKNTIGEKYISLSLFIIYTDLCLRHAYNNDPSNSPLRSLSSPHSSSSHANSGPLP